MTNLYTIGRWLLKADRDLLRALQPGGMPEVLRLFLSAENSGEDALITWGTMARMPDMPGGLPSYLSSVSPGQTPYLRVDRMPDGWLWRLAPDWKHVMAAIKISRQYRGGDFFVPDAVSSKFQETMFSELGRLFAFSVLPHGGIVLHAAVMLWRGVGVLLCAASGTGKTTHANLWVQSESVDVLNGDRALCGEEQGGWMVYGQPWCGSSGQTRNTKAKIGAVVLLERGETNRAEQITPFDGALGLMPRMFAPPWDQERMDMALTHLDSLVSLVPVFRLSCRPDGEAVHALKAALEDVIRD